MDPRYAAIVLAGGRSERLGGRHKPALPVDGVPMLHRVLAAVPDADPRIVVGPPQEVPPGVLVVREDPPYGGPAAAIAAGLDQLPTGGPAYVAVLAADQPYLTAPAVAALRRTLTAADPSYAGAAYVDDGRPQLLCGLWRAAVLRDRRAELGPVRDLAVRRFFAGLPYVSVGSAADTPPWWDCDTEDDWARCGDHQP